MKPTRNAKGINRATALLLSGLFPLHCIAQSPPGIGEFYQAGREIQGYYYSFSDLSMVLGAIMGLLGGLRVYLNWQTSRHHIDAQVMGWFFASLFLLLTGVFLRGLFGL
ncbi:DUF4134 family protein [Pedobacter roseus]|uniref:DUF4134 family protein n=1 Tax=Pedobacter roseus TaxID=336820 RepID=A0A7G9QI11_9SPHI|nr:DUF4134 family protein [Pedobacter roseus]QNN42986.1 DUF4134 family protein [Pedobacter roseus]